MILGDHQEHATSWLGSLQAGQALTVTVVQIDNTEWISGCAPLDS